MNFSHMVTPKVSNVSRSKLWLLPWFLLVVCITSCSPNQIDLIKNQENTATPDTVQFTFTDGYLVNDSGENYIVRVYIAESKIQYVDLRDNETLRCFLGGPIEILPDHSFLKTVKHETGEVTIKGIFYSEKLARISYDFGKGYCQDLNAETGKFENIKRRIQGETDIKPEIFEKFVE